MIVVSLRVVVFQRQQREADVVPAILPRPRAGEGGTSSGMSWPAPSNLDPPDLAAQSHPNTSDVRALLRST